MTRGTLKQSRHGRSILPWRTLLLTVIATSAYLALGPVPDQWIFDRVAIAEGEWWRLLTAHWVHGDASHAGWDIGALLLLGILFESKLQGRLLLALLAATVAVDAWLWWGEPALIFYCGLSGILNGLMILGLLQLWRDLRHPVILLIASGAGLKILVEMQLGQAVLTQTAWPSLPRAHAAGFACGAALFLALRLFDKAAGRYPREKVGVGIRFE